jgi:pimeloyl-ACP methyl ester carboxylesterase
MVAFGASFATAGSAGASRLGVISVPVSFEIRNVNRSKVACPTDGRTYPVRGHITAPSAALSESAPKVLDFYLYGFDGGEWNWRFTAVPGYDFPAEMAQLGHTSLTIDMLGYGASGHPNGLMSCFGSQADVTHQIVQQLRRGIELSRSRVRFSKIVLVAHDVGGTIAQIEAYSFGDINGLVTVDIADQGRTNYLLSLAGNALIFCNKGGEPYRPGRTSGYMYFGGTAAQFRSLFIHPDPRVMDALLDPPLRLRNHNPCGYILHALDSFNTDLKDDALINVPVLSVQGDGDEIFTRAGEDQQLDTFTGTHDKQQVRLHSASHWPMLQLKTATQLRKVISGWLLRHRLVSHQPGNAST